MSSKLKKFIIPILGILLMSIAILSGIHLWAINSDAYRSALTGLKENKIVEARIGKVSDASLGFFGHMESQRGAYGFAEMEIYLTGERGKGKVWVRMERQAGIWELKKGNLFLSNTDEYRPISIFDEK